MKQQFFMKKSLCALLALTICSSVTYAQKKEKKSTQATTNDVIANDKEINWISLDVLQQKMKQVPRKVYVDVYTDWCGWCKVMDKKTFTDPNVIAYINKYFYAVKFNAEQTDSVHFMGSHYGMEGRTNQFAIQLLRGQMSYPTTVILEEGFQNPQVIPGYLEVKAIEPILKYIGGNFHKTTPWEEFAKSYKLTW